MAEWKVGPTSEIGDVDRSTPTRLEDSVHLGEHTLKEGEVVVERPFLIEVLPRVVRRRGDHKRHGIVWQLGHRFRCVGEDTVEQTWRDFGDFIVLREDDSGEAAPVERGGVVALSP